MHLPELQNEIAYLFRAALVKCGNPDDAEDLTQEVLLAVLQYPREITELRAWLSAVLNHKYCDWLRKKYKLPTVSIDLVPDAAQPPCEEDDLPDASAVRREVAYLAEKYRTVVVRHYLYGEKVQTIADSLGVPKGTVLSRLSSGRQQMRKGFETMDVYEKQSYQPETLHISCSGCSGLHGQPYTLTEKDLMKQNILIAAYEQPLTVAEIARALGIPTAYVECAVQGLADEELMKESRGRYFTDFLIVKPAQLSSALEAQKAFVKEQYSALLQRITAYSDRLRGLPFAARLTEGQRKRLVYYAVLHLLSTAIYTACRRLMPGEDVFPLRPDGGNWIAEGIRFPVGFSWSEYTFPQYSYCGERIARFDEMLGASVIELRVYDTQPDLNRYMQGPVPLEDGDLAKLLYVLARNIPMEHTGLSPALLEDLPHLADCGILKRTGGRPTVELPLLSTAEYRALDAIRAEEMRETVDWLCPLLRRILPLLKIAVPAHLEGRIARLRQHVCHHIPMAFIKEAIERGDFDASNATPPMVLIADDANNAHG